MNSSDRQVDNMKKRKPYKYAYKDIATRIMSSIPENINIYIPMPFEYSSANKYFLLSCMYLHPDTNFVSVRTAERYIPLASRDIYMMYLGGIGPITFKKFLYEAMDINLMIEMLGKGGKNYYMINPVFAAHKNSDFNAITRFFSATSMFSGDIEVNEQYIKDHILPSSNKRMEIK